MSEAKHLKSQNLSATLIAGLMAVASVPAVGGEMVVLRREGRDPGYRMGRRSRPEPAKGYAGAKLAKKARKGTLTINGIR